MSEIGEIFDIYCVSKSNKPLAGLDFSAYGKRKLRKLNVSKVNEVIDYSNYKNVQYLHNKQTGGMYLKSVFFLPENYEKALKLMYVLWSPEFDNSKGEKSMFIGLLFGYKKENIIHFYKINFDKEITIKDLDKVERKLFKMKVTLEDLQKYHKIVHKTSVENI